MIFKRNLSRCDGFWSTSAAICPPPPLQEERRDPESSDRWEKSVLPLKELIAEVLEDHNITSKARAFRLQNLSKPGYPNGDVKVPILNIFLLEYKGKICGVAKDDICASVRSTWTSSLSY